MSVAYVGHRFSGAKLAGGQPVSFEAGISLATLGGIWRDSAGNAGTLVFNSASTSPR